MTQWNETKPGMIVKVIYTLGAVYTGEVLQVTPEFFEIRDAETDERRSWEFPQLEYLPCEILDASNAIDVERVDMQGHPDVRVRAERDFLDSE